jgi:hypothetical protein
MQLKIGALIARWWVIYGVVCPLAVLLLFTFYKLDWMPAWQASLGSVLLDTTALEAIPWWQWIILFIWPLPFAYFGFQSAKKIDPATDDAVSRGLLLGLLVQFILIMVALGMIVGLERLLK